MSRFLIASLLQRLRRAFSFFHFGARDAVFTGFLFYQSNVLAHPFGRAFGLGLDGCCAQLCSPLDVADVFRFVFRPEFADFIPGFLTGVSVFDLKHVDEFIELRFRFVHFEQVIFSHQTPPSRGLAADLLPFFLEYCVVQCGSPFIDRYFNASPLGGALLGFGRVGSFRDFVYKHSSFSPCGKTKFINSLTIWWPGSLYYVTWIIIEFAPANLDSSSTKHKTVPLTFRPRPFFVL